MFVKKLIDKIKKDNNLTNFEENNDSISFETYFKDKVVLKVILETSTEVTDMLSSRGKIQVFAREYGSMTVSKNPIYENYYRNSSPDIDDFCTLWSIVRSSKMKSDREYNINIMNRISDLIVEDSYDFKQD